MDTYANVRWTGPDTLTADWTTEADGKPLTQEIEFRAVSGLRHYEAVLAQGIEIGEPPPAPPSMEERLAAMEARAAERQAKLIEVHARLARAEAVAAAVTDKGLVSEAEVAAKITVAK